MADKIKPEMILVQPPVNNSNTHIPPKQSANSLFHFVDKLEYLIDIFNNDALIPRYCTEIVEYLSIGIKKIAYPMLCFCDINLHKLEAHISFYGRYGIAFSKEWGIDKGVQPIQYVNTKSILHNDFSIAFKNAIAGESEDSSHNYLLTQMYYLKAIEGTMERDGKDEYKNFTDECEWRFIPDVKLIDLPQAVPETEIYSVKILNAAIRCDKCCWLKFNLSDIKYIIIPDEDDFKQIISLINKKDIEDYIKIRLISKIILWSEAKGDF